MIASPSRAKRTCSWMTACVPTTSAASPLAMAASISPRAFFFWLPVSQATRWPRACSSGASQSTSLAKCCSARISVGAISAHCQPASMAMQAASAATTVLPLPTSPCSRRCMGCTRPRSRAISSPTRRCAPVSWNGSTASSCSCTPPRSARSTGARKCSRARRASSCDNCCANSSSAFRRCQAGWLWSSSWASDTSCVGWCKNESDLRRSHKRKWPISLKTSGGTVSDRSACARPASTALRRYGCGSCATVG